MSSNIQKKKIKIKRKHQIASNSTFQHLVETIHLDKTPVSAKLPWKQRIESEDKAMQKNDF